MNLYNIGTEYEHIESLLVDETIDWAIVGEDVKKEVLARFEELSGAFETKVESLCHLIKKSDYEANTVDLEIKRLQDLKKSCKSKSSKLKDWLWYCMKNRGIQEVKTDLFKVKESSPRASVSVKNADLVPDRFTEKVTTTKVDLAAMKKEMVLKKGSDNYMKETVDGFGGVEVSWNTSLQIK